MKVALVDVDGHHFPNLALMKLSAWHKKQGDIVEWYQPLFSRPDKIYASKVFTFTPDYVDYSADAPEPYRGGTGYGMMSVLDDEVENMTPDYSIYPNFENAIGFLTRGCIRKCKWCVVPKKEGDIRQVASIEKISAGRRDIVLMDNNFLAADREFVKEQLSIAARNKYRIDFNQGLDARLIDEENADWLSKCKYIRYLRFSCDTMSMLPYIKNTVNLLRKSGYSKDVFVYVLAQDLQESIERIKELTSIDKKITPFCQPYRDFINNTEPPVELKRLARWCNIQSIRKTISFEEYKG